MQIAVVSVGMLGRQQFLPQLIFLPKPKAERAAMEINPVFAERCAPPITFLDRNGELE